MSFLLWFPVAFVFWFGASTLIGWLVGSAFSRRTLVDEERDWNWPERVDDRRVA